jgi:hypothetical protein
MCVLCDVKIFEINTIYIKISLSHFYHFTGCALKKEYFASVVGLTLRLADNDRANFSGHSFRAEAATAARDSGFKNWELKMLGRWHSSVYNISDNTTSHLTVFV